MMPLREVTAWARNRASQKDLTKVRGSKTRAFCTTNQPFHKRVLEACRRWRGMPEGLPDVAFLAVPERLLSRVGYLCLGPTRDEPSGTAIAPDIHDNAAELLREYNEMVTDFTHLDSTSFSSVNSVLLCHGLSPIGDSILLLAELGRGYRLAWALDLPLKIMLADVSWMKFNRSVRQFKSLTEQHIKNGLVQCLQRREKFYRMLKTEHNLQEISSFDQPGFISGLKLHRISELYQSLAQVVWGKNGRLSVDDIRLINKPLHERIFEKSNTLPNHLATLGLFPKTLAAMEDSLKPHLEILRKVASGFSTFEGEVLSYFFSQYYAQQPYKGKTVKLAPESEMGFDEPFNSLDVYFQAWGEGHSTSDLLTRRLPEIKDNPPLAGIYLPQYRIGGLALLPYSPLSLDALRFREEGHQHVVNWMLPIDEPLTAEVVLRVLHETPLVHRNRLVSDLLSYLQACIRIWGKDVLDNLQGPTGNHAFTELMSALPSLLRDSLNHEIDFQGVEDVRRMWVTWFETCETADAPKYIPAHMYFMLADKSDWTEELHDSAVRIVLLARETYSFAVQGIS